AGASSTSHVHNTIKSYLKGDSPSARSTFTSAGDVTVTASETSTFDAEVGSGALSFAIAGESAGASIASNTADTTVQAYADNASLVPEAATACDPHAQDIAPQTLVVAPSVAITLGGTGAGATATATVAPTVEAYAGGGATLQADGTVTVTARSTADAEADSH